MCSSNYMACGYLLTDPSNIHQQYMLSLFLSAIKRIRVICPSRTSDMDRASYFNFQYNSTSLQLLSKN